MKKKYLFIILINIFGCLSCKIEDPSLEMKETEKIIHNNHEKTFVRKLLELCCAPCLVEDHEYDNDNILDDNVLKINYRLNYYENNFENIVSLMHKIKNRENQINTYFTKFEIKSDKELYIKFYTSLIESTYEKINERSFVINDSFQSFSTIITEKFRQQKYEFYIPYLFQSNCVDNITFVKVNLEPKLVDLYSLEKKVWKKMNHKILGESDFYSEFPLIQRLPFGVCPLDSRKIMTKTHFPLFLPALINGKLIIFDYLSELINKKLKSIELKKINKENIHKENIDRDFIPEVTIDDLNEQQTSKSPSSICNSIANNRRIFDKEEIECDSLTLDDFIKKKEIKSLIIDYLNKSSNSWSLISREPVKLNSIPNGYVLPNTGEALLIMLYAIENEIEIILNSGILTSEKKGNSNDNYFIEYIKTFNSIKIKSKSIQEESIVFIKKENDEENKSIKNGYQNAFMPFEYSYCICSEYCCHETILLKNPFFCCQKCFALCKNCSICRCPAISDFCIYPTAESWCERCEGCSCEQIKKCFF